MDRDRDREKQRQIHGNDRGITVKQSDRERYRKTQIKRAKQRDRQTDRKTDRQIDRRDRRKFRNWDSSPSLFYSSQIILFNSLLSILHSSFFTIHTSNSFFNIHSSQFILYDPFFYDPFFHVTGMI